MARFVIIGVIIAVAFVLYSLVDAAMSDPRRARGVSKPVWVVLIVVLPVIGALCAKQRGPVSSWKFFDGAIGRSIAENRAALEIPAATARATGPPSLTDRIAADHAEARRKAFALMDAQDGHSH